MNHRKLSRPVLLSCLFFAAYSVRAQPAEPKPVPILAGRPDADTDDAAAAKLLAPQPFTSENAGVTFRPPLGWKRAEKPADEEIVSFSNAKNWILRVTRASLDRPVPLVGKPANGDKPAVSGMQDLVIANFKQTTPDVEILRNEVINVDTHFAGIIVARYTLNGQPWLRQQAMVQGLEGQGQAALGEEAGKLYYVFNLITPAGNEDDDKLASDTFGAMIDTVRLLDRTRIKEDQVSRLYRTRNLFTFWNRAKFEKIVIPRQYYRILKNGKDAGYTFCEELLDSPNLVGVSTPGPIAYQRTHLEESDALGHERRTDAGMFKYMSFDRNRERWTRSVVLQTRAEDGHPIETYGSEFGESLNTVKRVFANEKQGGAIDPSDPKAPPAKLVPAYSVDVIFAGKNENAPPIHQDLPPYYIPEAAWHFLPRLVVDHKAFPQARTYAFAVYSSDRHQVMMLYVDKSAEQEITFAGQKTDGVTVTERIGLDGSETVHYLTPDGQYLGNEAKDQHLTTIACDEKDVLQRWPKANLTRPEPLQPPTRPGGSSQQGLQQPAQEPSPNRGLPPAIR